MSEASAKAFITDPAGSTSAQDVRDAIGTIYTDHLYLPVDEPPASPDAFDDEFDDNTITGWTAVSAGTAPTWSESEYGLRLVTAAEANHNWKAQLKAIPSGDWTVVSKLGVATGEAADFVRAGGLGVTNGVTSAAAALLICRAWAQAAPKRWGHGVTQLTNFTTFNQSRAEVGTGVALPSSVVYYQVTKSGTTYTFSYSNDGVVWIVGYSAAAATFGFTPSHIGLFGCPLNATYPMSARWEWIRKTA